MKAILVMYDSLNRHMLPPYGCDWVHAPNFRRLAELAVTFDTSYIGSAPTIPMRRELHTGRYNFLHRQWGPVEPFDDSMPELLKQHGVHAHLVSDGYHYWEDGGATYHNRYSTWQFNRGQEGDFWKADLNDPDLPEPNSEYRGVIQRQDWVNRAYMQDEKDLPQARTFAGGIEFLRTNHAHDSWFLQIETFDPHEPYFCPQKYRDLYDFDFSRFHCDWPRYHHVTDENRELSEHLRYSNAALVSMCDHSLGLVLDVMDELGLWDDTLLIVGTDHGFLLGEHGWMGKCSMPFYDEVARTPLFIWDPRSRVRGERRKSLVQAIDWAPTLLEYFGIERPPDMQGAPLRGTIADDTPVREAGLFGLHGGHVNVTDGRYVYMHAPARAENRPLFHYTHFPTRMRGYLDLDILRGIRLHPPFRFTKGCPVMQIEAAGSERIGAHRFGHLLFDTGEDPKQEHPIDDAAIQRRMLDHLVRLMRWNDAPPEQFERLGLEDAAGS